ncbi:hypothetical protein [Mucilaginibacter segetis]|uniref:DUF5640 domain-containing protein n=1 Tax=Mucilaginibacter segetis TaxID=2793071 RepID=A0A934PVV2_9SPHI|nr:hypothetical protein [Mucilaginibacter segetis]MBK0380355.1 hypothetical protein [Mucilaginibacter segetis]
MKIFIHTITFVVLITAMLATACSKGGASNKMLQGTWRSSDGETTLKITAKQFALESDSPVPEDYFIKGDTIFTSFEGNQPYTKFVIEKLDDHHLNLLFPDSVSIAFEK